MAEEQRAWRQLPMEVQDQAVLHLEPNEIAATYRLLCRSTSARYPAPKYSLVRLSQPVPTHAFAHRWGRPEAFRTLCHHDRSQLLRLTAASGSIRNLQLLLPIVGCTLHPEVLAAAAAAGHLATCQWLREQGCPWDESVSKAAGRSGSRALCDWLIPAGCPGGAEQVLAGAARAGHVRLVDQLLASYGPPKALDARPSVVAAAAHGFELPAFKLLHDSLITATNQQLTEWYQNRIVVGAVSSPTPDWRDKVEWLEAQGYPRTHDAFTEALSCVDAVDRLKWLGARDWPLDLHSVVFEAVRQGDVPALEYLLDVAGQGDDEELEMSEDGQQEAVWEAAMQGHLQVIQFLHGRGWSMYGACANAAGHGHLHVVAWLVEALGEEDALDDDVFPMAVDYGSLPMLQWLKERGCFYQDGGAVSSALEAGISEEVLDWLLEQGCEPELKADMWVGAAGRGDLGLLARLRRLSCPWADDGSTFTAAVSRPRCPLPALRWLLEAGCPVDWAAVEAVRQQVDPSAFGEGVAAWLEEQRRQREGA